MSHLSSYFLVIIFFFTDIPMFSQTESMLLSSSKNKSNEEYITSFKNDLIKISRLEKQNKPDSLCLLFKQTGDLFLDWKIYEKANEYYFKSYTVCNILPLKQKEIFQQLINNMALTYYLIQDKDSSLFYYNKLLDYQQQLELKHEEIVTMSKIVSIYLDEKRYKEALNYNIDIFNLNTDLKENRNIGISLNNIGFNYKFLNDFTNAITNFKLALEIFKSLKLEDSDEYQVALLNLGILYQNTKDYNNANDYLNQLENILIRNKKENNLAELYNIKANICFIQNNKEQAIEYCSKSELIAKSNNNLTVLKAVYLLLSQIYQNQKDNVLALKSYQKYKEVSDSLILLANKEDKIKLDRLIQTSNIENQLKLLSIEKEIAEFDVKNVQLEAEKKEQFYQFQIKSQQAANQNKIQDLVYSQQKFEVERQLKKILILNQQNAIQTLAIRRNSLERTEKEKTIEILSKTKRLLEQEKELGKQNEFRQRIYKLVFGCGFILLSLFTLFFLRSRQKEHNSHLLLADRYAEIKDKTEEISTQHELLLQQTKNITDSMEYAKIIQQALFTNHEILDKCKLQNFIFFKPRDIISGDFYWFRQIKNYVYFTAADCTGHGVPGAFMSVLGISLLNEIVSKRDLNPPALVLNEFRKRLKKSLNQDRLDTASHDGIDITLCLYDTETQQLQYSGAYNPLIVIRNNELQIYKTDKMPIGMHPKDNVDFTNHEIQLFPGDLIYVFSDGFISQFGGQSGKKFNVKKFYQLLLDIHKETLDMQKQKLENTFYSWQAHYEQIDDILVIGIKVNDRN